MTRTRFQVALLIAATAVAVSLAAPSAAVVGPVVGPVVSPVVGPVVSPVVGDEAPGPTSTSPPRVLGGDVVVDARLRGTRGQWDAGESSEGEPWTVDDLTFTYQWRRDGKRIREATAQRYRPVVKDLGHRLSVRVLATDPEGGQTGAPSEETTRVRKATLENRRLPDVDGTLRYTHRLRADAGRWSRAPVKVRYRWTRAGKKIDGATSRRYEIAPRDVGRRVRVKVRVTRPGYRWSTVRSAKQPRIKHRVDATRTATYHVETRGEIVADLATFKRLAAETYADARGWRGGGVAFKRVDRGGDFTLVLAEASTVPSFSSVCSAQWSCRVGRYVIINQMRWRNASEAWNDAGRSLRDYRHLVVNHETGHWLGYGHPSCPRRGAKAPVMMPQSKGTGGCTFNPWPTRAEQDR